MFEPPVSIRIGPFDWAIEWYDQDHEADHQKFGMVNSNSQIIRLTKDRKRQRVATTFIHEVLHALWHVYGIDPPFPKEMNVEELMVDGLAYALSAFVRDNPRAMQWYIDLMTINPSHPFILGETKYV